MASNGVFEVGDGEMGVDGCLTTLVLFAEISISEKN